MSRKIIDEEKLIASTNHEEYQDSHDHYKSAHRERSKTKLLYFLSAIAFLTFIYLTVDLCLTTSVLFNDNKDLYSDLDQQLALGEDDDSISSNIREEHLIQDWPIKLSEEDTPEPTPETNEQADVNVDEDYYPIRYMDEDDYPHTKKDTQEIPSDTTPL